MNQILYVKDSNYYNLYKKRKKFYKLQFYFSSLLIFLTIFLYFTSISIINKKALSSKQIADNYNILKLYDTDYSSEEYYKQGELIFKIIGFIEIQKLRIFYPIISESNDELLKIAPCRLSGPMPGEYGNLCIAGHNYDNEKFFSKISNLKTNDLIILYDNLGKQINYYVKDLYEISENDFTALKNYDYSKKELTLITCNNFNISKRIVLKAFA